MSSNDSPSPALAPSILTAIESCARRGAGSPEDIAELTRIAKRMETAIDAGISPGSQVSVAPLSTANIAVLKASKTWVLQVHSTVYDSDEAYTAGMEGALQYFISTTPGCVEYTLSGLRMETESVWSHRLPEEQFEEAFGEQLMSFWPSQTCVRINLEYIVDVVLYNDDSNYDGCVQNFARLLHGAERAYLVASSPYRQVTPWPIEFFQLLQYHGLDYFMTWGFLMDFNVLDYEQQSQASDSAKTDLSKLYGFHFHESGQRYPLEADGLVHYVLSQHEKWKLENCDIDANQYQWRLNRAVDDWEHVIILADDWENHVVPVLDLEVGLIIWIENVQHCERMVEAKYADKIVWVKNLHEIVDILRKL